MLLEKRFSRLFALVVLGSVAIVGCSDGSDGSFTAGSDLQISVRPNPVTFGSVATGTHAEETITIEHTGKTGTLDLESVRFESASTELKVDQPLVTELEPGESTTMLVRYDPVDALNDNGVIFIKTNVPDPATGTLTVQVPVQTVSQLGFIRVLPNPVNFGDVEVGEEKRQVVSLLNTGSDSVTIEGITVRNGLDGEVFGPSFIPTLPATFAPQESITFELACAPLAHGASQGSVTIDFTVQGAPKEIPAVTLTCNGVGPRIEAFPDPVDFGWRPLDQDHRLPLSISNKGTRDLVITGLALAPGASDTVSWDGFPATGETIAAGAVRSFDVVFRPTSGMQQTTGPIATLVFTSNDLTNEGQFEVNVFGRAEVPVLTVNPGLLDFGYVAQGQSQRRVLSLFNAGSAPLTVTSVVLTDNATNEFEITPGGWGPTLASPTSVLLQPSESREVEVRFTNDGASTGTQFGKLRVSSNDGTQPEWDVDLKAQRAGSPTCEFTMVPAQLDFGTVARGARKTLRVNLVNTGSGACSFQSWLVNDCQGFFGFFGGNCSDPANTAQTNGNSTYYRATSYPLAVQGGLRPGESYPIDITFTPPETAPIFGDELVDYAALLALRIHDPFVGGNIIVPAANGAGTWSPNLHAKSGIAQLAVLPSEVDFGLTTIGCYSQTIEVTAYNVGSAPLDLTDIKLQGCSPEFRIKASPGLPATLAMNGSEKVSVVYVPQDTGSDSCGLAFYTNNEATPTVVVPLDGQGTYETEHTDTFTQTTGQDVDVLFVIDDSGSMSEEQTNLANNFQSFIGGAATWQNDFHIGVVTTDLEAGNGRLVTTGSNARFVTTANQAQFAQNAKVGTNGSGDEKGLACAQAALSLPNTAGSGAVANLTACSSDTDCTAPERCWDNYCGGRNRGFLREDAALEVVIVSDEEDNSPSDLNFYINFFKSIKGFYNENLFHLHAIVGDVPNGCSSGNGDAAPGQRYVAVANATGGAVVSVCDGNFASGLSSIGDIAFGLRTQFFLGRLPEPSTITVAVAGTGCQSGSGANWLYDEDSNSVVFAEAGACMPAAGQQVQIHYKTICFLP